MYRHLKWIFATPPPQKSRMRFKKLRRTSILPPPRRPKEAEPPSWRSIRQDPIYPGRPTPAPNFVIPKWSAYFRSPWKTECSRDASRAPRSNGKRPPRRHIYGEQWRRRRGSRMSATMDGGTVVTFFCPGPYRLLNNWRLFTRNSGSFNSIVNTRSGESGWLKRKLFYLGRSTCGTSRVGRGVGASPPLLKGLG